ncbi:unnamed protein product [Allacma fusca]|uniref:G-protein coupled receptors family 1 profile domain-containing protein n=1 Tax=Allacma fusca TaxID=39272 RepID=A0A8J2JM84_9HEXA|nr:unnamed protein product [Allacma fusca]
MYTNTSDLLVGTEGDLCGSSNASGGLSEEKKEALNWIAYKIIGPTIVSIGLLGNVLNLIVLTRPSFKGVTYTYLIGLACSDIGVLLCAVAFMIRSLDLYPKDSWLVSIFYAHMELPLANTFMASSIFIVVCLTVDRFASVCMPTKFKSVHTSPIARTAILVCYLLASIISIPLVKLKKICDTQSSDGYKVMEDITVTHLTIWNIYSIAAEVIVRFGPAVILTVLNTMIILRFRKISQKRREMRQMSGGETLCRNEQFLLRGEKISKKIYKEEKRLVVLLMSIVLLFFVTTTPVAFLNIFYTEALDDNFSFQIFRAMANDLELCNFALNFYIYFLCSKEFRKKFLSFFQFLIPYKAKGDFQSITLPEISHAKTNLVNNKAVHNV